jgi:hypothetical protein
LPHLYRITPKERHFQSLGVIMERASGDVKHKTSPPDAPESLIKQGKSATGCID